MKFSPGAPVDISVHGVPGASCKTVSEPFEKIVGGTVISTTPTAEATQPAMVGQSLQQNVKG